MLAPVPEIILKAEVRKQENLDGAYLLTIWNHSEWLRLEDTSEDCKDQPPYSEQVAQGHTPSGSEYFQGLKLHNLSGQYVPVFYQPCSTFVFLCLNGISYIFQFVPIFSCLVTGYI